MWITVEGLLPLASAVTLWCFSAVQWSTYWLQTNKNKTGSQGLRGTDVIMNSIIIGNRKITACQQQDSENPALCSHHFWGPTMCQAWTWQVTCVTSLYAHRKSARSITILTFQRRKRNPEKHKCHASEGGAGSRNQDTEEQRPACPRTPTMRFGEDGFVLFSSINWGTAEWKWDSNQKLPQSGWQSYSQLTKNKAGWGFISPCMWDSISVHSPSPSLCFILKKKK